MPTADAGSVFISLINENVITNSKKSRVAVAVWFGALCLLAPALFTPLALQAKETGQVMFPLSLHKNPFSQDTPLKPEIEVRRWQRWGGGDHSL